MNCHKQESILAGTITIDELAMVRNQVKTLKFVHQKSNYVEQRLSNVQKQLANSNQSQANTQQVLAKIQQDLSKYWLLPNNFASYSKELIDAKQAINKRWLACKKN